MNETPFWVAGVFVVALAMLSDAFVLPTVVAIYRLENWLVTWPMPKLMRAERREAFEQLLAAFLAEERRQGYSPRSSGMRLFVRLLTTLPIDIWEASRFAAGALSVMAMRLVLHQWVVTRWPRLPFTLMRIYLRVSGQSVVEADTAVPVVLFVAFMLLVLVITNNATHQLMAGSADGGRVVESASVVKTIVGK